MISRALAGVALTVLVLLPACGRRGSPFAEGDGASSEVDVVGPATLRIDGRLVRLADVSVPQPAPRAGCWAEALLAREAIEVLEAETNYVRDLEIRPVADAQGGRARVLVHGRDLSRLLIQRGLAAQTGEEWDWCGPLDLSAPRAPRLGYRMASPGADLELRSDTAAAGPGPGEER